MSFTESIRNFFVTKNKRELYIYYAVFLAALFFTCSIIIYTHFRAVSRLTTELKRINKLRTSTQELLVKNKEVLAQQEAVKAILAEEPNFYIGHILPT